MPRYTQEYLDTPRPTLYARRTKGGPVHLFRDPEAPTHFISFGLHDPQRPRHGRQWITILCKRYKLEWLPDTDTL